MKHEVPHLAVTAERVAGEMMEMASTYEYADVTGKIHEGAAWLFEELAQTPLSTEIPTTLNRSRSLDEAIEVFCQFIDPRSWPRIKFADYFIWIWPRSLTWCRYRGANMNKSCNQRFIVMTQKTKNLRMVGRPARHPLSIVAERLSCNKNVLAHSSR